MTSQFLDTGARDPIAQSIFFNPTKHDYSSAVYYSR